MPPITNVVPKTNMPSPKPITPENKRQQKSYPVINQNTNITETNNPNYTHNKPNNLPPPKGGIIQPPGIGGIINPNPIGSMEYKPPKQVNEQTNTQSTHGTGILLPQTNMNQGQINQNTPLPKKDNSGATPPPPTGAFAPKSKKSKTNQQNN